MGGRTARAGTKLVLAVALLASVAAVPRLTAQRTAPAPEASNPGYPVDVDGLEVLRIYEGVGSFSAQDRAANVADRLQKLVNDPTVDVERITIVDSPFGSAIELGDNVLLAVTDNDARRLQLPRDALASYYLKQIRQGITTARLQHSKQFLLWALGKALVTLLIYLAALWVIVVGFRKLLAVLQPAAAQLQGIKIQRTQLLEGRRIAAFLAASSGRCVWF